MGSILPANRANIERAADLLIRGRLVAFPTETVYGLGAVATRRDAIRRLFEAKGRPPDHPVIVHLARAEEIDEWCSQVPAAARALADAFMPGPLTLVLPRAPHVSTALTGGQETIGLRVPSHPVAAELLSLVGGGVAAPSANRFGHVSPTAARHVEDDLGDCVDAILDGGPSNVGLESTIVDLSGERPRLLRPGVVTEADLCQVLGRPPLPSGGSALRAPGTLERHYAPATPARLVSTARLESGELGPGRYGVLARTSGLQGFRGDWCVMPKGPSGYGRQLYARLREFDRKGLSAILIEEVPEAPEWRAIRDRLVRATRR